MSDDIELVPEGSVTTPGGFLAGAVQVGVRSDWQKLDLGLLYSPEACTAAGVFTSNRVKAAPLVVSEKHLADGRARAVIANSGCANAATGEQGLLDAVQMARLTGEKLGIDPHEVVVASTGVIGTFLPMDRIGRGVEAVQASAQGGPDFARSIMTTDTRPKHLAARCGRWSVGGVAKGVGMIHPNMATMLCFLTTDAPVASGFLAFALKEAVDASFNMIDVDSDTSTNDMAVVLANGAAGGDPIDSGRPESAAFLRALSLVCRQLARMMVADAEGGTRVIEVAVEGALSVTDARRAAREVVGSLGVKTMVYGSDPNWGRILAAVGNSGAAMAESKTSVYLVSPEGGELCLFRGSPQAHDRGQAKACLTPREVRIRVDLGMGGASATAWGSDMTEDYVRLNSLYTT